MTDLPARLLPRIARAALFAAAAAFVVQPAVTHADGGKTTVVQRDDKAYLYRDGKPLTKGYDDLSIETTPGYPDLAIATDGDRRGLLDASTGKIVLPAEYAGIDTDSLAKFGLVAVRGNGTTRFVTSEGKPSDVPAYVAIGDFGPANDHAYHALAERDGKLLTVAIANGHLVSEAPAPRYLPIVILPPALRTPASAPSGRFNGAYVPAEYPDLQSAWAGWKRGALREPGQPAIVLRGDVAYVSFGEFASDSIPLMPNTLQACQSEAGVSLRDGFDKRDGGCASKAPPLIRLQPAGGGALRCVDCAAGIPEKWIPLPSITQSFVGIGVALRKRPNEATAQVVGVIRGGPAEQAKLQPGDFIAKVNGEPVAALSLPQVVDRIRGEVGTRVTLDVVRGAKEWSVEVERRDVKFVSDAAQ